MNTDKIGKFIALNRKSKGLTQEQLAEKLKVTNKTISRWETGKYMPDLSLLLPLCEVLDISLNELLSGEKIKTEEVINKSEKNLLATITYTNQKIKETQKNYLSIFLIFIIFIITFITIFTRDINRMQNNQPVLFSTWGLKYTPTIDLKEDEMKLSIINYLLSYNEIETTNSDNKTFISMKIFLIEEENNIYNVYSWVLQESYYLKNNEIYLYNESSIPYKFVIEKNNNNYKVTDSRIPRDGNYYETDIINIFPNSVRKDIETIHTDGTLSKLKLEIKQQLEIFHH